MQIATRRAALAAGGMLAAGTVAAVTLWRKPVGHVIATPMMAPDSEPVQALAPITAMKPTVPPVVPPEVALVDAQGATHRLAEFAGKGVLVNLWATWCAPCVAEMPALQVLARAVKETGILVLPLSSDRGGADAVRAFYKAHGIDALPVWLDPKGMAGQSWAIRGLPTTLAIDRQGREVGRFEGAVDWAAAGSIEAIKKLIG